MLKKNIFYAHSIVNGDIFICFINKLLTSMVNMKTRNIGRKKNEKKNEHKLVLWDYQRVKRSFCDLKGSDCFGKKVFKNIKSIAA